MATYDAIGTTYARTRIPDVRIEARLRAALDGAASVVNVGAGTGAYEPDTTVAAVEPSEVMIAQRTCGSAPAVRGVAEQLPLRTGAADAVMAVLTIHHWSDVRAGLAELRRVARRRVVVLTWDHEVTSRFWLLADYLPQAAAFDATRAVPVGAVADALGGARVAPVPVPADCTDGFAGAYWRRPQAYLDPEVRAGMSVLAQVGDDVLQPGLARLEDDLATGEWHRRYRHLERLTELDIGYRLVVADVLAAPARD